MVFILVDIYKLNLLNEIIIYYKIIVKSNLLNEFNFYYKIIIKLNLLNECIISSPSSQGQW